MTSIRHTATRLAIALAGLGLAACSDAPADDVARDIDPWPAGETQEQIDTLADHIGGFSPAMREVGYRYNELYFAGREANWDLADYHLAKIASAIERGIERRPRRAPAAREFLAAAIPEMETAIEAEQVDAFGEAFEAFAARCNECHAAERVAFIEVAIPERKLYPWTTPGND